MKTVLRWLAVVVTIIPLLSLPAYAGWKAKVTKNQEVASAYIMQLKSGKDPDKLIRPHLRRSDKYKAKQSQKEIKKAMDEAEAQARAGKHKLIKEPEFTIKGLSE